MRLNFSLRCLQGNLPSGSPPNVEDLQRREKELAAKEAELQRWEADLRATGGLKPKNNWPLCCPIVYLDIDAEVGPMDGPWHWNVCSKLLGSF